MGVLNEKRCKKHIIVLNYNNKYIIYNILL